MAVVNDDLDDFGEDLDDDWYDDDVDVDLWEDEDYV